MKNRRLNYEHDAAFNYIVYMQDKCQSKAQSPTGSTRHDTTLYLAIANAFCPRTFVSYSVVVSQV